MKLKKLFAGVVAVAMIATMSFPHLLRAPILVAMLKLVRALLAMC